MQKLNSIQGFARVREGEAVGFISEAYHSESGRTIKMSINTPQDIWLYAESMRESVDADGGRVFKSVEITDPDTGEVSYDTRFLAFVRAGYDQIEFVYTGHMKVTAVGGEFWLNTFEGSNFEVQATDPYSYARVLQREEIDPRVAAVQYEIRKMQREAAAQRELDRLEYEQRLAAIEAAKAPSNVTPSATASAASETGATGRSPAVGVEGADGATGAPESGTGGGTNAGTPD